MKTVRLDFSGGVNVITDKSVLPDKFATVMDNIDLRSGFPRCIKEPIFYKAVAESNTKQIFSYRGRWLYSDNPRSYASEFTYGSEKIYWSEAGTPAQKMVEGVQAILGTPRPSSQPLVSAAQNIVPRIESIQAIDGGNLAAGSYYYAVSAEFANGITAPSSIASKTFTVGEGEEEKNVKITWSTVPDAIAYVVFGRVNGYENMQRMVRLDATVNTFTDDGALTPSQDKASIYFDNNQVGYVYTYERLVVNSLNESGLSAVSEIIRTNSGRNVTRDYLRDGFLSQPNTISITDNDNYVFTAVENPDPLDPPYPYYPTVDINSFVYDRYLKQVIFSCIQDHHLNTGDKIKFSGASWTDGNYKDKTFEVIVTSATTFAIKNIPAPTDSIAGLLQQDSLLLENANDNYQGGITATEFPLSGGFGSSASVDITTTLGTFGVASITNWDINNDGNGKYRVGDLLTASVPSLTSGQPTTASILGLGEVTQVGTGYDPSSIPASLVIDGMSAGIGYPDGPFAGKEASAVTGGGSGMYFSGTVVSGAVSPNGLSPDLGAEGSGFAINDTFEFAIGEMATGSGFVGKIQSLQAQDYVGVDIIGANSSVVSGSGATADFTIGSNGMITNFVITDGGDFYDPTELLTIDLVTSGDEFQFYPSVTSTDTQARFLVLRVYADYTISVGKSRISISPNNSNLNDGDAIYLNMKDSGDGGIQRVAINYYGSGYDVSTIEQFFDIDLIYADDFTGNGTGAKANITFLDGAVIDFVISEDGLGYAVGDKLTIDPTDINSSAGATSSALSITVFAVKGPSEISGLFRVYKNDIYGNPIPSSQFDINLVVDDWDGPTQLGASATWTPYNGYYKTWNIYRSGAAGAFQLVERVDIYSGSYLDTTSAEYLGEEPTSYYTDTGIFGQVEVDYDTPPVDLIGLTSHYGMMFGISGQSVQWTPINAPDAWPATYSIPFSFKPLALASFGTGLIVLCEDAIYRIDGNQPSSMSLSKTMAEDGCIAPYSVQLTSSGLVYLSKRGLMLFDGMNVQCITDSKISPRLLLGPSKAETPYNFWWLTTKMSYLYANFANKDKVFQDEPSGNRYFLTNQIPTPNYDVISFYQHGKYYLVFTGTDTYEAHTTLCVDLMAEGMPITTLGLKPKDVFVDEFEDAYILVDNQGNGDSSNFEKFKTAQSSVDQSVTYEANSGLSIWKLFSGKSNVPMFLRSGQKGFGNVTERRRYEQLEFYGDGTLSLRVYMDGRFIVDDYVTMTEAPHRPRRINMPRGNRMGYVVDIEVSGDTNRLVCEYAFTDLKRPS